MWVLGFREFGHCRTDSVFDLEGGSWFPVTSHRLLVIVGVVAVAAPAVVTVMAPSLAVPAVAAATKRPRSGSLTSARATGRDEGRGQADRLRCRRAQPRAVNAALEELNWRSSRTIDIAILTHPHEDHVPTSRTREDVEDQDGGHSASRTTGRLSRRTRPDESHQERRHQADLCARSDQFDWGGRQVDDPEPTQGPLRGLKCRPGTSRSSTCSS